MRNRIVFAFSILCCLLIATSLSAQATGTWVSGVGDDANPCSRTAPCKTFAGAISKTAACGEIRVLDPGGFGAVTITKSITIDGTGTLASILNPSVNGIIVNLTASDACNTVILRNLAIRGTTTSGLAGIRFLGSVVATNLHVEGVKIAHQQRGIDVQPSVTNHRLFMKDVDIRHTTVEGIDFRQGVGINVRLHAHDIRVRQSAGNGIRLSTNVQGTINQSQFEGNVNGVNVASNTVSVTLVESVLSNNTGHGLINGSTATTRIDGCTITGNTITGVLNNTGGIVQGFGNNAIAQNGTDVNGAAIVTLGAP